MRCEEALELITGLVDGELSPAESSSIRAHFGDCANCPQVYSLEASMKRALRQAAMEIRAPAELRQKILGKRRRSLHGAWALELWESLPRISSLAAQGAVMVALFAIPVLTARYWRSSAHIPIVAGIFQNYGQIARGEIVPSEMTSLQQLKERLMRSVDGKFAPMAYDFSTMQLHLAGGMVRQIGNREVMVAVYKGNGATVLCYTFLGSESDAPEIAEIIFEAENGMNFYQFFYSQINAVMHREGNVMCILMGQIPREQLLALARAKAHTG